MDDLRNFTTTMDMETANVTERINISVPKRVFDETGVAVLAGLVLPLSVFGIFANALTICVIYISPNLKSVFNYFILSLATSDLISALLSPLAVYYRTWGFDYWNISTFLCKLFWGGSMGISVLTSLHITVYSALRFVSLKWPHQFTCYTIKKAKITVLALWVISFFSGALPFIIWMSPVKLDRIKWKLVRAIPSCGVFGKKYSDFLVYSYYGYTIMFFIPCLLVFLFSGGASILICIRRVKRGKKTAVQPSEAELFRQRKENQAIAQLLLICGSFFLGYVPICVDHIVSYLLLTSTFERQVLDWWFGVISTVCLQLSESLNPIVYNLASSNMRRETFNFLRRVCSRNAAKRSVSMKMRTI